MTDEKGRLLEGGSKELASEQQHHISTPSPSSASRMGRFAFLLFLTGLLTFNVRSQKTLSIEQRVDRILSETPLIGRYRHFKPMLKSANAHNLDGHDDLPILVRMNYNNRIYGDNFTSPFTNGSLTGHVDLPRLSKGKVGGTFWSVFVECPKDGLDWSDENYAMSR